MTKDKSLEHIFLTNKPTFSDSDKFMESLSKRLDAVEYLKRHEEACVRRYKRCIAVAFVLGIVCGGGMLALVLSSPADVPLFALNTQNALLLMIEQNSRLISTLMLSALICFGIVSVVSIMQDLTRKTNLAPTK